jgi:hypothetical protein
MINAASSSRSSDVQGMDSGSSSPVSAPARQPSIQKNQKAFSLQKAGKSEEDDGGGAGGLMKMLEQLLKPPMDMLKQMMVGLGGIGG